MRALSTNIGSQLRVQAGRPTLQVHANIRREFSGNLRKTRHSDTTGIEMHSDIACSLWRPRTPFCTPPQSKKRRTAKPHKRRTPIPQTVDTKVTGIHPRESRQSDGVGKRS
jgi:hypothetical protein